MSRRAAALRFGLIFGPLLSACELPHHDTAMQGTADWVLISYAGDLSDTLPIARRHCAQYERQPVLRQSKENSVLYMCVKPGAPS